MPPKLLDFIDPCHLKLIVTSAFAGGLYLAQLAADLPPGWEDKTMKGLLIAAILYLVRQLAMQRTDDKADALKREEKMVAALDKNSATLAGVIDATHEQTSYFRDVAKNMIDAQIKSKNQ